jgi:feruloyl esterase
VGTDDDPAWGERAAQGNLRLTYGIPSAKPFNPHDYDLAQELENLQRLAPLLNATDPDLSGHVAAGGKLFYYQGMADPLIVPGRARQYFEEVAASMDAADLDKAVRFVMVPGHGHCWEKPGMVADDFNPLAIIDRWVESGSAPEYVIGVHKGAGNDILRSRKLCAAPGQAVFRGGNPDSADSYYCEPGPGPGTSSQAAQ